MTKLTVEERYELIKKHFPADEWHRNATPAGLEFEGRSNENQITMLYNPRNEYVNCYIMNLENDYASNFLNSEELGISVQVFGVVTSEMAKTFFDMGFPIDDIIEKLHCQISAHQKMEWKKSHEQRTI